MGDGRCPSAGQSRVKQGCDLHASTAQRTDAQDACIGVDQERGAILHHCDFNDKSQPQALIDSLTSRHKRLRALIHNASDWMADDDVIPGGDIARRMTQMHVIAPYQLNLALAPLLEASQNRYADIIHVGDYVSSRGSSRKHIAYAASKAAQDNLTFSFSAKLAPKVKVSSVAPALVLFNDEDDESYRAKALRKSLMEREGGLAEFQHAIDYLLDSGCPAQQSFLSGANRIEISHEQELPRRWWHFRHWPGGGSSTV